MKIRPEGAKLFHEEGRTDMKRLTFPFRNVANAPNKTGILKRLVWFV